MKSPRFALPSGHEVIVDQVDVAAVTPLRMFVSNRGVVVELTPKPSRTYTLLSRFLLGVTDRKKTVVFRDGDPMNHRRSNLSVITLSSAYEIKAGRRRQFGTVRKVTRWSLKHDHRSFWIASFRGTNRRFSTRKSACSWINDQRVNYVPPKV